MQIVLGPFHPHLEEALLQEIRSAKQRDPLAPLLVLVPSDGLRQHLQTLLTRESPAAFLNLSVMTFYQLTRRILDLHLRTSEQPRSELFFEEVLRSFLRGEVARTQKGSLSGLAEVPGGCAALWQTFRDLKDGLVDPKNVLAALDEGHFGESPSPHLRDILSLYDRFQAECHERSLVDYTDLDLRAGDVVRESAALKSYQSILYYGFYDLTQVQVDLFQSIVSYYPVTIFFPLIPGDAGWSFAQRFFDRHVVGRVGDPSNIRDLISERVWDVPTFQTVHWRDPSDSVSKVSLPCTVWSCSGVRDEVLTVAKEILRLVTDEGVPFDQIGVVSRRLDPYQSWIHEILPKHGIPVKGALTEPLLSYPLTKAVLQLTSLSMGQVARPHLLDLLQSPYFRDPSATSPDETGIVGNEQRIQALFEDIEALSGPASWTDQSRQWSAFLKRTIHIPNSMEFLLDPSDERVYQSILDVLHELSGLDAVSPSVSGDRFIQVFQRWLGRISLSWSESAIAGVSVLDAMQARGISFRALFLLGMNEGMFPRVIREDPFLQDKDRNLFNALLGHKIPAKKEGHEEERLLYMLLLGAARERIYILYQRSDHNGSPQAPSWYVRELLRDLPQPALPDVHEEGQFPIAKIPRGLLEKRGVAPFDDLRWWTPDELPIVLGLSGKDPTPFVQRLSDYGDLYIQGKSALEALEGTQGTQTPYDGHTGPLPGLKRNLLSHGLSATVMEAYARCPFQFFAHHVLNLRSPELSEDDLLYSPSSTGRLAHGILVTFYQTLIDQDHFNWSMSPEALHDLFLGSCQKVFEDLAWEGPLVALTRWPVLWEVHRIRIQGLLWEVVQRDFEEMKVSGFHPIALEVSCKTVPGDLLGGIPLQGRLDRIDASVPEGRFRIIDYKIRLGKEPKSGDRDLWTSAIRGLRLQPPLYRYLAEAYLENHLRIPDPQNREITSHLYYLAPEWRDGPLVTVSYPEDGWSEASVTKLKQTLNVIENGILEGCYYILPGTYCEYCDLAAHCRRTHRPTLRRLDKEPKVIAHRTMRSQKVTREGEDR